MQASWEVQLQHHLPQAMMLVTAMMVSGDRSALFHVISSMKRMKLDEMMILACVVRSPEAISVILADVVCSPLAVSFPSTECACSSEEDTGILHLKFGPPRRVMIAISDLCNKATFARGDRTFMPKAVSIQKT
jgi:hypothetical protein